MRLFVALELPADVVATLVRWSRAAERPGLRLVRAESLHITLAFLGERPEGEAEAIGEAIAACAAPVGDLRLADPAWLGRGSALSLDLIDGAGSCASLQHRVSAALTALGVYEPEARPFRPHVTVARVRRGARVSRRLPDPPDAGTFAGTALTLFQSSVSPQGARYRPLTRAVLA